MDHGKVVLGTAQLGLSYGINNSQGQPTTGQSFAILSEAIQLGITTLDTARAYGTSLEVIGKFHDQTEFRFDILSKFKLNALEHGSLREEVAAQLELLRVPKLKGISFHSFPDYSLAQDELRSQLVELKEKGLVENIGVSTYTIEETVSALQDVIVDVVQFPFNALDNYTVRKAIFETNLKAKKQLHVRSVFLQGLFFMDPASIPTKRPKITSLAPLVETLQHYATEAGMSMTELALRYALSIKQIDAVVLGVDTPKQLREIFAGLPGKLSLDIVEKINRIVASDKNLLLPTNW